MAIFDTKETGLTEKTVWLHEQSTAIRFET